MPTVNVWSNVDVNVQSALGAAQTISGITKADPAVVQHSGVQPSNGDYVLLEVEGMSELDSRVARVANAEASPDNNFELEGIDSSEFGTFSSGTFKVITFGTSVATATGVNASGGEAEYADASVIHKNVRTEVPVVFSPFQLDFENLFDPGDSALDLLKAASEVFAERAVQLVFSSGAIVVFNGYVGATGIPTGSAFEVAKTQVSIRSRGLITAYSS